MSLKATVRDTGARMFVYIACSRSHRQTSVLEVTEPVTLFNLLRNEITYHDYQRFPELPRRRCCNAAGRHHSATPEAGPTCHQPSIQSCPAGWVGIRDPSSIWYVNTTVSTHISISGCQQFRAAYLIRHPLKQSKHSNATNT